MFGSSRIPKRTLVYYRLFTVGVNNIDNKSNTYLRTFA